MGNNDLIKDLGVMLPNRIYNFTVFLNKPVKQVQTNCGCISVNMTSHPQILEGTFKTSKEFPFQISSRLLTKIQLVNLTYVDGTNSTLKVTGKLINVDKINETNQD